MKDQKFGILDAQALLANDLPSSFGLFGAALIYLDIDHFKALNTKYTERTVDRTVLPQFQRLIADAVAGQGHAYAEGGDEIILLLPNQSKAMAEPFTTDLLAAIRSYVFYVDTDEVHLTVSAGLAVAEQPLNVAQLPEDANEAKRRAKMAGRDRVVISDNARPAR